MRKIKMLLCIVLSIALLSGCANQRYKIINENGVYYIQFNNFTPSEKIPSGIAYTVSFGSIEEMISDFQNGTFSDRDLRIMIEEFADDEGRITIPDLSNLIEPVYPSSREKLQIIWGGRDSYSFYLCESDAYEYVNFTIVSEESYSNNVYGDFNFDLVTDFEFEKIEKETERDATVYYYLNTMDSRVKRVNYKINRDGAVFYISEVYHLEESPMDPNPSDTIPSYISVYATDSVHYFKLYISGPTERPSVEWLSSFGLKEYEG